MMKFHRTLVYAFALLALGLCLAGGIVLLVEALRDDSIDTMALGIELYFCGKALFVGPMLVIAGAQLARMPVKPQA